MTTDGRSAAPPRPGQHQDARNVDTTLGALVGEAAPMEVKKPDTAFPLDERTLPAKAKGLATYYEQPILKEPVWKWYVPTYFYTGGVVGASAALGAAAQIAGGPRLRPLVARARWTATIFSALSAGLLIADLGRPSRFLYMLRVFRPSSPMNVGTWIVSASGATSALAALFGNSALGNAAGLAAGAVGLPMSGYTAVLVSNSAVPVWNAARSTLPALFVASGMSAAASLLDLFALGGAEGRAVTAFGLAGKVAEIAAMRAVEAEVAREGTRVARPLKKGRSGTLWRAAKVLTAASAVASLLPVGRSKRATSGLLGTAGALALRFAVLAAGRASARDPRASFEPMRRRRKA